MGHHNIRYDGDPYALKGAWSPPTSRAKYVTVPFAALGRLTISLIQETDIMGSDLPFGSFCEEDYVVTVYLAEFINSLSNSLYGTSSG